MRSMQVVKWVISTFFKIGSMQLSLSISTASSHECESIFGLPIGSTIPSKTLVAAEGTVVRGTAT